jgi:hypothetical protein
MSHTPVFVLFLSDTGAVVEPPLLGRILGKILSMKTRPGTQAERAPRTPTTPLSQTTLMRSCTPLTPCGIFVKSSLPIAFCFVVNGRWSDATMFRVSLRKEKEVSREGRGSEGGDRLRKKARAWETGKAHSNLGSAKPMWLQSHKLLHLSGPQFIHPQNRNMHRVRQRHHWEHLGWQFLREWSPRHQWLCL